jgi:hypothetical protein
MRLFPVALLALFLAGCAPEVGSERWCKKMEQTERGEWTMNDAADYARHCILR